MTNLEKVLNEHKIKVTDVKLQHLSLMYLHTIRKHISGDLKLSLDSAQFLAEAISEISGKEIKPESLMEIDDDSITETNNDVADTGISQ